jgi:hypothetical protein
MQQYRRDRVSWNDRPLTVQPPSELVATELVATELMATELVAAALASADLSVKNA